ncbi:helix-turn-helix domain-containing protein [Pseudonocardia sp.]|uniref:helix-turn-helix domain-containing protein n=1 Tax=Pseudonocardia sp. TaxID=60912 RepID=UPI003452D629
MTGATSRCGLQPDRWPTRGRPIRRVHGIAGAHPVEISRASRRPHPHRGIHRSTARYRLYRIRQLIGVDPEDPRSIEQLRDITGLHP